MSLHWKILKKTFLFLTSFETKKFERSLALPEKAQKEVLEKILISLGIRCDSLAEFREKFPVSGEEQIAHLSRRLAGRKIITYETTSGSSGKPKKIPYTRQLMTSFHHMFRLWARDVLRHQALTKGTFFFSISPQTTGSDLQEDSDYLQKTLQWVLKPFLTVDAAKLRRQEASSFMKRLSYELLQKQDLEIISVWSPSYFLSILNEIKNNQSAWSQDQNLPAHVRSALKSPQILWKKIWPRLSFISAWGSAMAELGFQELKKQFPQATLQKKGLLATEAPMTIPWTQSSSFIPLIEDIFFEFIDEKGTLCIVTELKKGAIYELVITTPGGLLRYSIQDLVKVTGFYKQTPCLDFVGRAGDVCDLAGEKFSEPAIRTLLRDMEQVLGFYILVPDQKSRSYILFSENDMAAFGEAIDQRLQNIFHYQVARQQGQLGIIYCHHLPSVRQDYFRWLECRQMRFGDIKEKSLISNLLQAESFLEFVLTDSPQSSPFVPENKL